MNQSSTPPSTAVGNDTPTATIAVTISQFAPIGSGKTTFNLAMQGATPTGIFSFSNNKLTISASKGQKVHVVFSLTGSAYVLIGVALKGTPGHVGRGQFPHVDIRRSTSGSTICVTDVAPSTDGTTNFTYDLVIQETQQGQLGLIDPDIETDVEN